MALRYTDTDKWKDGWYLDLSVGAKLLFHFLCEMCDIAGFFERSDRMMEVYLHMDSKAIDKVTEQIHKSVVYRDGIYFVRNFMRYQKNLPLNLANNCHVGIINKLIKYMDKFGDVYKEVLDNDSYEEIKPHILGASKGLGRGYGNVKVIGKGNGKKNTSTGKNKELYRSNIETIIKDLNTVCGTNYRIASVKTREMIVARLKEGHTVNEFKKVHRVKYSDWAHDDEMSKYLRPETLYRPTKFEGYLNQLEKKDDIWDKIRQKK